MITEVHQSGGTYRIGNETADNPTEIVYVMTRFLAGVCDGAVRRDDVGFNGAHARFGRAMASTPIEQWTPRQTWAMRQILETYKNTQLAHVWRHIPDIPEPQDAAPLVSSYGRQIAQPVVARTHRRMFYLGNAGDYLPQMRGVDALVFDQNYDPGLLAKIKELPGRRYDGARKVWLIPLDTATTVDAAVTFACEHGYDIDENTHGMLEKRLVVAMDAIESSHADDTSWTVEGLPENMALYPFQRAGVEYAAKRKRALIGDDMGLGKTPQALVTAWVTDAYPMLVICPASLKDNWAREARKWTPQKTVAVMDSRAYMMDSEGKAVADIIIVNYDVLKRYKAEFVSIRWGMVVCDECHKLKNPKSKRHIMVEAVIAMNPGARVLFLSGTPVVNEPMEFWSLIKLLGYGPDFGGERSYRYRYDTTYRPRLEELSQKSREKFMVRRTKKQVLTELPDKTRTVVPIAIDNREHYDEVERDLAAWMASVKTAGSTFDPTEAFQQVLKLGLSPEETGEYLLNAKKRWKEGVYDRTYSIVERNEQLLRWGQLKQLAVEGKMNAVFDWLDEFIDDTDEKIVVFVWHVEVGKRIAERYGADFVYGGMDVKLRQPAVDRFSADDGPRMIVGNIQAAGEGLNMQAASHVAFVEYGWNPKDHNQAEDRCHRIGQKSSVTAWYLAAQGTIEDEIAALIASKLEVVDAIQEGSGRDAQMEMIGELSKRLQQRRA